MAGPESELEIVKKAEKVKDENRELPFNRVIPPDLPLLYSDHMVIKHQDGMFLLYFFQNRTPLALTPEELNAIDHVDSYCVAQILVTPEQMQKNITAMAANFAKFFERRTAKTEETKAETPKPDAIERK
mgnify:CR=1 FL=1